MQAWFFAPEQTGGLAGSQQAPVAGSAHDAEQSANWRLFGHLQTRCLQTPKQHSAPPWQDLPSALHPCAAASGDARVTPNAASASAPKDRTAERRDATAREKASKRAPSMVERSWHEDGGRPMPALIPR
jgi:hypothetical protein